MIYIVSHKQNKIKKKTLMQAAGSMRTRLATTILAIAFLHLTGFITGMPTLDSTM